MTVPLIRRLRTFWANPVVTRDLRARMRGTKSYWHQAAYLLLLGLVALLGYSTAVGSSSAGSAGMSAVDVQGRLQSFYYFIFVTLAALITLIAPALTAVSITTERQSRSLDLLVTTPLTASELLVGKMISSVAFLALLLALSLPASALCVILGGATLGDVIRVYLLLAIDGLFMAAIGLAVSCAVRDNLPALVWSYLLVALLLILTTFFAGGMYASAHFGGGGVSPQMTLGVLNPFIAVYFGAKPFLLFGKEIPLWVGTAVVALILIRLLVTAATCRLGSYGREAIGSLRRQVLFVTGLVLALFASSLSWTPFISARFGSGSLERGLIIVFILAAPLLPSLFTPAVANEDDPPGRPIAGWYSLRNAFRAEHSGALPYYHLWLLVIGLGTVLGSLPVGGWTTGTAWTPILLTLFYLSGLGFVFWALSRRAATLVKGITAARALSFIFFAVLAWLPMALLGLLYVNADAGDMFVSPLAWLSIFFPLTTIMGGSGGRTSIESALLWSGAFCYGLGVLVYPFWRSVVPGGRPRKEAGHVPSVQP